FALMPGIFDDHAHAMPPVVIREIAHDPHARMVHFDQRGEALGSSEPKDRHVRLRCNGIAVERHYPEAMPGQSETADLGRARIEDMEQNPFAHLHSDRLTVPE